MVFLWFSHGFPMVSHGGLGLRLRAPSGPGLNWHAYEFENDGPLLRGINDVGPCTFDSEPWALLKPLGDFMVILMAGWWLIVVNSG